MQRYGFTLKPAIDDLQSDMEYIAMDSFDDYGCYLNDIADIDIDTHPPVLRLGIRSVALMNVVSYCGGLTNTSKSLTNVADACMSGGRNTDVASVAAREPASEHSDEQWLHPIYRLDNR